MILRIGFLLAFPLRSEVESYMIETPNPIKDDPIMEP